VYELSGNLLRYSQYGYLIVKALKEERRIGIQVISVDHGRGIKDEDLEITEENERLRWDDGTVSLGTTKKEGFERIRDNMDEVLVEGEENKGSRIVATKCYERKVQAEEGKLNQTPYLGREMYHVVPRAEWESQKGSRTYKPERFEDDGFIHFSADVETALMMANRFYKNSTDEIVLLKVDVAKASQEAEICIDNGKEKYPHLYGLMPTDAVLEEIILAREGGQGVLRVPEEEQKETFPIKVKEWERMLAVRATGKVAIVDGKARVELSDNLMEVDRLALIEALEFGFNEQKESLVAWMEGESEKEFTLELHGNAGEIAYVKEGVIYVSYRAIRAPPELKLENEQPYLEKLHQSLKIILSDEVDHLIHPKDKNVHVRLRARIEEHKDFKEALDEVLDINILHQLMVPLPELSRMLQPNSQRIILADQVFVKNAPRKRKLGNGYIPRFISGDGKEVYASQAKEMFLKIFVRLTTIIDFTCINKYDSYPLIGSRTNDQGKKEYLYGDIFLAKPKYKNYQHSKGVFKFDEIYLTHYVGSTSDEILAKIFHFGINAFDATGIGSGDQLHPQAVSTTLMKSNELPHARKLGIIIDPDNGYTGFRQVGYLDDSYKQFDLKGIKLLPEYILNMGRVYFYSTNALDAEIQSGPISPEQFRGLVVNMNNDELVEFLGTWEKLVREGYVINIPIYEGSTGRLLSGGYIEEVKKEVDAGDKVTLRAVANRPDLTGQRKVYLYSNNNTEKQWRFFETPLTFVGNRDGCAFYEIALHPSENFDYTFAFEGFEGELEWAELPYGNSHVDVMRKFTGSVVFVGMEFAPFIKVGGQGDVMYELPKALAKAGSQVSVIIPYFKSMADKLKFHKIRKIKQVKILFQFRDFTATLTVKQAKIDNITVYMLDVDRPDLFIKPYPDNRREFYESILLSRGALELLQQLNIKPDVIHSNDHHTALIPLYMRKVFADYFAETASVFTVHNIGYQGVYPLEYLSEIGVGGIESLIVKSGKLNFMAVAPGVIRDIQSRGSYVNTVSMTYAEAIRHTPFEVDMLLCDIENRFNGILNGIDFDVWSPRTDPFIKENYSIRDGIEKVIPAKRINKTALKLLLSRNSDIRSIGIDPGLQYGHLKNNSNRALIGVVSRIVGQKQLDIIGQMLIEIENELKKLNGFDLVILGTADDNASSEDKQLEEDLALLAGRYPN
ncbi:DUF952 domain-containing protein, partial [Candidatus Pacearchaeota archaeon]|nr:DUF952 domain-containing protein [Candidatus Pacearchaeota archaeon]